MSLGPVSKVILSSTGCPSTVDCNGVMAGLKEAELCKWEGVTGKKFHLVFKGEHYFAEKGRVSAGSCHKYEDTVGIMTISAAGTEGQQLPGRGWSGGGRRVVKVPVC